MKKIFSLLFLLSISNNYAMQQQENLLIGDKNYNDLVDLLGKEIVKESLKQNLIPSTGNIVIPFHNGVSICPTSEINQEVYQGDWNADIPEKYTTLQAHIKDAFNLNIDEDTLVAKVYFYCDKAKHWGADGIARQRNFLKDNNRIPTYLPYKLLKNLSDKQTLVLELWGQPCEITVKQTNEKTSFQQRLKKLYAQYIISHNEPILMGSKNCIFIEDFLTLHYPNDWEYIFDEISKQNYIPSKGKLIIPSTCDICSVKELSQGIGYGSQGNYYNLKYNSPIKHIKDAFGLDVVPEDIVVQINFYCDKSDDWRNDDEKNFLKREKKIPQYLPYDLLKDLSDGDAFTLQLWGEPCEITVDQTGNSFTKRLKNLMKRYNQRVHRSFN